MQLVRREPGVWYFDTHLWVPKNAMTRSHVASMLTYEKTESTVIRAWEEAPHHYKVPRNFLSVETLLNRPQPVVDARWKNYPHYDFKSRVILDAKEPGKTYQADGSRALLNTLDGILCLRCGAGKTLTALHTVAQTKQPFLVVVNDKGLARQWVDAIKFALGLDADDIGRVGGDGSPFDWQKPAVVALVQTLAARAFEHRLPAEMVQHFGTIICDEAHTLGAPFFNQAIPPFPGRRWGLSATPTREDGFDSLLNYTIGPVVFTYLKPNLVPTVIFKRLDTRIDHTRHDEFRGTHDRTGQFHRGLTFGWFARARPERTERIVKDILAAKAKGRQILVLTHSREMVELLGEHIPGAGLCHGDVSEDDRIYRIRNCNPVIAVMQLGKQALDKESLDTLFLCEPTTKQGVIQQVFGRILRTFHGKQKPLVVIYEDRYIQPLFGACQKIRYLLRRWPEAMGGKIPYIQS